MACAQGSMGMSAPACRLPEKINACNTQKVRSIKLGGHFSFRAVAAQIIGQVGDVRTVRKVLLGGCCVADAMRH
eukprot:154205-Lingulodinium_polyedra.AAC.1